MPISLHKSESIGVILETLAYGAYLIVFSQCIQILTARRVKPHPRGYLLWTAVVLWVLVTMHLCVDIDRNMEALDGNVWTPDGAEKYYQTLGTWKNVFKSVLYVASTVVSDAFIVYRCYIVWGRNRYVIPLPLLLFLADIGAWLYSGPKADVVESAVLVHLFYSRRGMTAIGIYWCYTLSLVQPGQDFETKALSTRVTAFYAITLSLNFICTILIAYKIRMIQHSVASYSTLDSELTRVVAMVVESGAIYSAYLIIMIATYSSGSPTMFIFLNSISPIIGIVFSAVIVRVGLGLSHGDRYSNTATTSRDIRFSSQHGLGTRLGGLGTTSFPEGVQISLEHTVHMHRDGDPDDARYDRELDDAGSGKMATAV
ncbi:hypothetical protein PLICRDRAFT_526546 [Plicaturopsis crispa FD-325 SS-3]|nr:hypothetical protein PLICRDRAFT_526546 [Plicaturopsis crispa FD-325 SS-3]